MRTLGIDLASKPNRTAACSIEWSGDGARVQLEEGELDDAALIELFRDERFEKVAVDSPFGWPTEFAEAVVAWSEPGSAWPIEPGDPEDRQARLLLRETDREVLRVTGEPLGTGGVLAERRGKRPLSVSADKLGVTAMRCARLLAAVGQSEGRAVDRAGGGRIVEVYPDAALREWGFWPAEWDSQGVGYKGSKDGPRTRREELLDSILDAGRGWLNMSAESRRKCVAKDDPLDALISALVGRAAAIGKVRQTGDRRRAAVEGWIQLPLPGSFSALRTGSTPS